MQWSKNVLRKEVADQKVLEYVPQKFDLGTPDQAFDYLKNKKEGSDFRMNDVIRVQTGVEKIERVSEEEKIEEKALEKLKEIQEQAYSEAYQLGLDEGRKKAFDEYSVHIEDNLTRLSNVITSIENMKTQMISFNESHLVQLMFHMASRIAYAHLENNNPAIIDIIRSSVSLAQDEEEVTIRVSNEQYEFLEELKKQSNREYDFLKKVKLEPSNNVQAGGCIVETNFGVVDARIEQRVKQLWEGLADNTPKVKDKISSDE